MKNRFKTLAIVFGCSLCTAMLVGGLTALADSNPATDQVPRLIPYQGTLEKDGVAVTGQVPLTFSIFDRNSRSSPFFALPMSSLLEFGWNRNRTSRESSGVSTCAASVERSGLMSAF